jgi:hypothetical protein
MDENEVIRLYQNGILPGDVVVMKVPITHNAYNEIVIEELSPEGPLVSFTSGNRENIKLRYWGSGLYAGYGTETKTLIIGELKSDPDPRQSQPANREQKPL